MRKSANLLLTLLLLALVVYIVIDRRSSRDSTSTALDGPRDVPLAEGSTSHSLPAEVPTPSSRDLWSEGIALYGAGSFSRALPLLEQALADKQAPRGSESADTLAQVRLFTYLFRNEPPDIALSGPPLALVTTPGGDTFLTTVVSETGSDVRLRHETVIFTLSKATLDPDQIARTAEQKKVIARKAYRLRLDAAARATPPRARDYFDLARFARAHGLSDKVGYCMRQALTASGDAVERALFQLWSDADTARAAPRADILRGLLRHFYPHGDLTRRAHQVSRYPVAAAPPSAPQSPGPPDRPSRPSGIGEAVPRRSHTADPELDALLADAHRFRQEGDEHYVKARPGSPEAATHRRKALDAYGKAIEIYEKVEERWDVSLERTFKDLMERRYQLLKDSR